MRKQLRKYQGHEDLSSNSRNGAVTTPVEKKPCLKAEQVTATTNVDKGTKHRRYLQEQVACNILRKCWPLPNYTVGVLSSAIVTGSELG